MMRAFGRKSRLEKTEVAVTCPVCEARMRLKSETDMSEFGSLDIKMHRLECENCGMQIDRVFHPSVGYQNIAR